MSENYVKKVNCEKHVICISCDKSVFVKYTDTSYLNLPVYRCENCGLGITGNSEYETRKVISQIYSGEYWNERNSETSIISDYSDIDSEGKKRNWLSQFSYCKPYLQNKKNILEIGAGAGQASYWFEKSGFLVTGIEPDERNAKLINQKLEHGKCIPGFIEDIEIKEKFDILWMSHVLEHLVRPDIFLTKIKNNLISTGIFFIEVPNCENRSVLDSTLTSQPHTYHFSKNSLTNICNKSGFKILKSGYFRPASFMEGGINKIIKKYLKLSKIAPFPYYPRIETTAEHGRDLRIILTTD